MRHYCDCWVGLRFEEGPGFLQLEWRGMHNINSHVGRKMGDRKSNHLPRLIEMTWHTDDSNDEESQEDGESDEDDDSTNDHESDADDK